MVENPYDVLGVSRDASADEVKKAYRKRLARTIDLNPNDPAAADRMNKINEAYDRIVNPESTRRATVAPGRHPGRRVARATEAARDTAEQAAEQARGRARAVRVTGPRGRTAGRAASGSTSTTCSALAAQVTAAASPSIPRRPRATTYRDAQNAIDAINAGRGQQAVDILNTVTSDGRSARWYYLSALANDAAGNTLMALEQIRRAVRIDPNNPDYQRAQRQFQQTGQTYQQESQSQGFSIGIDPSILCCGIWCLGPRCRLCGMPF